MHSNIEMVYVTDYKISNDFITVNVVICNMKNSTKSIEDSIVETTWEEKDLDLIVQYQIYKKLNLESVDELSQ